MEIALNNDIVSKSGAWFSFGDIRLGQGKENVKARLETEPELFGQIEKKVMEIIEKGELDTKPSKKKATESTESDENDTLEFAGDSEGIIEEEI